MSVSRRLLFAFAMFAAAPICAGAQGPSRTQTRFVSIDNLQGFSGFFNVAQGTVRIVAVVSPTSPEAEPVLSVIEQVMSEITTNRLRAYVVFVPLLEGDDQRSALMRSADFIERRVAYFWDPNRTCAAVLQPAAASAEKSTQVCYLFDTDAVIREQIDKPVMSMPLSPFDADALAAGLVAGVQDRLQAFDERRRAESNGE